MNTRGQKKAHIDEYHDKFGRAEAMFLADYRNITSNDMAELRGKLREAGVEFRIMKNTLARIAVKDTPYEALSGQFVGTMAVALSYKDCALAAKSLIEFAKAQPNLEIKTGAIGVKLLGEADIKSLAALPGRDELMARLLGGLNNIPAGLVGVLGAIPRKLLYALNAVRDAKERAA